MLRYTKKISFRPVVVFFALHPKKRQIYRVQLLTDGNRFMAGNKAHAYTVRDSHLGRCRNITSHRQRRGQLPAGGALHILAPCITHTIDHGHHTAPPLRRAVLHCAAVHGRGHSAPRVPAAQQLTGGAPAPHRTLPRAHPAAPPPGPRAPRLHPLFTDGRPVSGAFAVLHDERLNLMPFLCPASNAIRLGTSSFGILGIRIRPVN